MSTSHVASPHLTSHPWSAVDLFDDEEPWVEEDPAPLAGIRLPDGRTLAWAEYGNPRGLPCILVPDTGSSRLAPRWLLHDTALPASIRLLAVDRPGIGSSDPVEPGDDADPTVDLIRLIQTLAVGRVALVGVGSGVDVALDVAERFPAVVTTVLGISPRLADDAPSRRRLRFRHQSRWEGPVLDWAQAARGRSLSSESTWRSALNRMAPAALEVIGDRWREADFRRGVAADVEQGATDRHLIDRLAATTPAATWPDRWNSPTPVRLWHGRHDTDTHVSALRAIATRRADWEVVGVSDRDVLLGGWPELLRRAEESFRTAPRGDAYAELGVL